MKADIFGYPVFDTGIFEYSNVVRKFRSIIRYEIYRILDSKFPKIKKIGSGIR